MNGRIGLLHCGYRVVAAPGPGAATAARLDRLAREPAPRAMAEALDDALGDDPTVYVLRDVQSHLLLGEVGEPDEWLARRWGEHLARSVLEAIAHASREGAGSNLVRFGDEADHVAQFLEDLLDGHAWDRWFHARFSPLRGIDVGPAVGAVLLEHRERLPAVLGLLQRRGVLGRLLDVLDEQTLRRLWRGDLDGRPSDGPETARPVFLAALRLIDRLALWDGGRPDTAALWAAWVATRPRPPDWRERAELEATLEDVVRLLSDRGHLRPLPEPQGPAFRTRLEAAVGELDWLDADKVCASLVPLLARRPGRPLPPRPAGLQPTPRQRALLADLARLLQPGVGAGYGALDSAATALRLHTELVAACPRWRDDPMARTVIERLLAAAAAQRDGHRRPEHDPTVTLEPDGAAVVAALAGGGKVPSPADDALVDTGCAGVYLLLRGVVDAGLPRLADRLGPPSIGAVLLGLGLRWGGRGGVVRGRIDPGLAMLGGPTDPGTLGSLRAAWKAVPRGQHRRWQAELLALPGLDEPPDEAELDALAHGRLRLKHADRTLALGAVGLLRTWGCWLRGFSGSTTSFLLASFVRRPGQVARTGDDLLVRLEPRPLDVILAIAGYTDELDLRPLYGAGRLRFEVGGS